MPRADARPAPAEEEEAFRTHIVGEFKGWTGTTIFRLENGQIWTQTDWSAKQWVDPVVNPEVELKPEKFFGRKLYYLPKRYWMRVRRLD
jgi:hypothetical protein